jgi:hypothetical protein
MKRIIKLTESDLTRIVKRVVSEQSDKPPLCTEKELSYVPEILNKRKDLDLSFNKMGSGVVTIISESAKLNCFCQMYKLMPYLKKP